LPRKTRARKPSHFGSNRWSPPCGSSSASFASIGSTGGAMAYNSLAALGMLARLLREALWVPVAIVLASMALARLPVRLDLWWLAHLAGGAALAFCYLRAIAIA